MATRMSAFRRKYGPWAVVLGSAEGIGSAYAQRLAADGFDLALVDLRAQPLKAQAGKLAREHGVQTRTHACDLSNPRQVDKLLRDLDDVEIGLLIFNAAASAIGPWHEVSLEAKLLAVNVNVLAVLRVTDALSRKMIERRRGGIILTSSMAALQGAPRQAVYAATKSFDLILAESLWAELRPHKVDVLGLIPGMVKTPSFERSGAARGQSALLEAVEPQAVVDEAFGALGKHASAIPGRVWKAVAAATKLLPRDQVIGMVGRQMKGLKTAR